MVTNAHFTGMPSVTLNNDHFTGLAYLLIFTIQLDSGDPVCNPSPHQIDGITPFQIIKDQHIFLHNPDNSSGEMIRGDKIDHT